MNFGGLLVDRLFKWPQLALRYFKNSSLQMLLLFMVVHPAISDDSLSPRELYTEYCSQCHGEHRLGGVGPALLPDNLRRLKKAKAKDVISHGRVATQMPAFGEKLAENELERLTDYIFTLPDVSPQWTAEDIRASQVIYDSKAVAGEYDTAKPVYDADPLNLFLVVESGTHHVTVLDGDKFEPIHRFKSRFALHGGPKYSSTGRYVYFASRDGWITKFDMYRLKVIAEIRAGINTRNVALSGDDRYLLVGNYLPRHLVFLDADDLSLVSVVLVEDKHGNASRVSAVYTAAPRDSFVVALKDIKEIWEVFYSADPPRIFNGLVHDYQMGEGLAESSQFPIQKIKLDDYFDDFFFDQGYRNVVGAARNAASGQVVNLDAKRKIADVDLPGLPHLGSGITWPYKDTAVLATPNLKTGEVSIIDMRNWSTIKRIKTQGPGFFMRSHENSPYAWVDVFTGKHKDVMHVIDKQSLEIVKTLTPAPGKTSGHIEFTRDGRHALLSIWENEGELIVYDAHSLQIVKRLPMDKPVGKYNVYNKITRSQGTSH